MSSRRVVVTGVGLLCGVGIGTEAVWKALCAGQSGIGPITLFDASQHPCRFAGEVKNFDPLQFVEKKELKKMGRFIVFALAATDFAMKHAGLVLAGELAERTGVEDIYSLVAMLIHTDRLGTSIAQSLRAHAESMRTRRRQRAEQLARKASIKMAFPLVFLILPALLVIILGPAAIQLLKALTASE